MIRYRLYHGSVREHHEGEYVKFVDLQRELQQVFDGVCEKVEKEEVGLLFPPNPQEPTK